MIYGLGFGVWGLGFGVWGLGFGVGGLGSGVCGLGFEVWGLRFGCLRFGFEVSVVYKYITISNYEHIVSCARYGEALHVVVESTELW